MDELHGAATWVMRNASHGDLEFESLQVKGGSHLVFEAGGDQDTPFPVNIGAVYGDTTEFAFPVRQRGDSHGRRSRASARLACDFVIAGTSSHSPSDTLDSLVGVQVV
ncbi:hypothetical protein ACOMHN_056874 [Nucella lapillus]